MTYIGHIMMMLAIAAAALPGQAFSQVAGETIIGTAQTEMKDVAMGWSAKKHIMGQPLYNEKNEKVGTIDDVIIAPDKAISYAIVGAGGFIGIGKHDVAIPVSQIKQEGGKFILRGASKEAIKAMPEFQYARSQ
ncbi:MAG TPA: PRC-barrel domain-containing protein [Nitrospiraceae bacterium]|jgi:sporulation protein YlmC with PRC-barrel domain|nr:PRC-barrel domain-containing protein [Nitrospiraceae bacterium]